MALSASVNIDGQTPIEGHDEPDRIGQRPVVVLNVDNLAIHFSSWEGNEAVCRNLDRLIGALTELRAKADARLVDEIVDDWTLNEAVKA